MAKNKSLEKFNKRMQAIPKAVRKTLAAEVVKAATTVAVTMRTQAPVDTGALRDSIRVTGPGQTTPAYSQPGGSTTAHELQAIVTVGDTDTRYPHLVEYGTAEAEAQPFFWPVVRSSRKRITNRVKRAINKAVKGTK
jgi:HK97 gp10 family phage protein